MGRPFNIFEECYIPEPNSGCYLWLKGLSSDGYPVFRRQLATRLVLEEAGFDLTDLLACHKCHNPICVNLDHLYPGTHLQNMQDAQRRGTFANLAKGRDAHWASQSPEERSARTANGAAGVKAYLASKTPEERSEIARHAANARWGN